MALTNATSTVAEKACHALCFVFTLIGLLMVAFTVNDNSSIADDAEGNIIFAFAVGCFVSLSLLLNAGRTITTLFPLTLALAYYWFPKGVSLADSWRYESESDNSAIKDSDLSVLLTGAVFSLFGSLLGVLVEITFPKQEALKKAAALEFLAVIGFLIVLVGCLIVWIKLDRDWGVVYVNMQRISIQAILAALFSLDVTLSFDPNLQVVAIFMAAYSGCDSFNAGVTVADASGDLETVQIGFVIVALGLLMLFCTTAAIGQAGANEGKGRTPA